jgi:hypothetical protein
MIIVKEKELKTMDIKVTQYEYKTLAEMSKGDCFLNNKGNIIVFDKKIENQENKYYVHFFRHSHFGCFPYKDTGKLFKVIKKADIF